MRGDDRSSRYPPRGVWFGLILAAGTVRALLAQDVPDAEDCTSTCRPRRVGRKSRDPVDSGRGDLGAARGGLVGPSRCGRIRARRPSSGSPMSRRASRGSCRWKSTPRDEVRLSGANTPAQPSYRGVFRTTEVQLKCYDPAGPKTAKDPPWDLAIIRRSGFLAPKWSQPCKPARVESRCRRTEPVRAPGFPWFRRLRPSRPPGRS